MFKEPDWGEPAGEQTWWMAMCYGTVQCLTLRFCHFFQEIFPSQQMKSRSLHSSGSGTRREARLIPMTWLVSLLPTQMSRWIRRRSWALNSGFRPWAMLGSRSRGSWPASGTRVVGHYVFVYYLFLVIVGFIGRFLVNYHDIAFLYFDDIFLWHLFVLVSYFQFQFCW